jgi:hypothetical protein
MTTSIVQKEKSFSVTQSHINSLRGRLSQIFYK